MVVIPLAGLLVVVPVAPQAVGRRVVPPAAVGRREVLPLAPGPRQDLLAMEDGPLEAAPTRARPRRAAAAAAPTAVVGHPRADREAAGSALPLPAL